MGRRRGRPRIKRAVIVGIDEYQVNDGNINLKGCVNDARDIYNNLRRFYGFKKKHIKFLSNSEATKQNILDALTWMITRTRPKQEAVYFHSGHGSQVVDTSGDEVDRLDEVVIPYDFNWTNIISDDDIAKIFKQIGSRAHLTMICDTCYSGGMAKGLTDTHKVIPMVIREENAPYSLNQFGVRNTKLSDQKHLLLSACREGQYSEEFYHPKFGWRGVFSFFFGRHLYNYRRTQWSIAQIYERVNRKIDMNGFVQNPTLFGPTAEMRRTTVGGRR